VITRRQAILTGLGLRLGLRLGLPGVLGLPAVASDTKEFWNTKTPSDWTAAEIQQLLTKSPWAKEGSINDTARRGGLSSAPAGAGDRRRGRAATSVGGATAPIGLQMKWGATIRWDSALPVREALHRGVPGESPPDYILNVFGEVPGVESDSTFETLKDLTSLAHRGDQIAPNRIESAPKSGSSAAGTLFYFSRLLALSLTDEDATFSTKLGPLEVKCKFTLKDMRYRGNLEL
jgi:hypothetical protein